MGEGREGSIAETYDCTWLSLRIGIHQRNMLSNFVVLGFISCCMLYIVAAMWVMVRVEGSIREIYAYRPVRIFMQKANKTSLTDVAAIDGLV